MSQGSNPSGSQCTASRNAVRWVAVPHRRRRRAGEARCTPSTPRQTSSRDQMSGVAATTYVVDRRTGQKWGNPYYSPGLRRR
jgi:hypothetical protein